MVSSQRGKDDDLDTDVCPDGENDVEAEVADNEEDPTVGRMGIVFLGIPILGFIMYLWWRTRRPEKAKTAGCLALLGLGLGIVVSLFASITDSQSHLQRVDYPHRYPATEAARVRRSVVSSEIYNLLRGDDLPWIAYMLIWNRLEKGTEVYTVVTDIFFDSKASDDKGNATLRDLSDGRWRKAFAQCALKYPELQMATVETMQEISEADETQTYLYSETVRVLTTEIVSLEQLLLHIQTCEGRYDHYDVVCGTLPEATEEVGLDALVGVYVDEGDSLVLRTVPSYEDQRVQVTPMHLNELTSALEVLTEEYSDYTLVCSESDPNDDSARVRIDAPVSAIGINDEHQLFVLLSDGMILSVMDR